MLEQLFGSKVRTKLLGLFLTHPQRAYFVRELARITESQINSIRRELENLFSLNIIEMIKEVEELEEAPLIKKKDSKFVSQKKKNLKQQKKYYQLNSTFILYPELRALFLKAKLLVEKDFLERMSKVGNVSYLVLTGMFVALDNFPTDLLMVGKINKKKFEKLICDFEKVLGRRINYTIMSPEEFKYRRDITDRFLYSILEGKKIVMIDKICETK